MITSRTNDMLTHSKVYKRARFSVLREEYLAITGSYAQSVVLDQMIVWARTTDRLQLLIENNKYILTDEDGTDITKEDLRWTYKSAKELSAETLLTEKQCRDGLQELTKKGYLERRRNPKIKWDKTFQYKINYENVINAVLQMGFGIEALKLSVLSIEQNVTPMLQNVGSMLPNVTPIEPNVTALPSTTTSTTSSNTIITPVEEKTGAYDLFIKRMNEITNRKFTNRDKKAKRQLELRLKEGYTMEDLENAIRGCLADDYHKETNYKYLTPEFITRSDKLERYRTAYLPTVNVPQNLSLKEKLNQFNS